MTKKHKNVCLMFYIHIILSCKGRASHVSFFKKGKRYARDPVSNEIFFWQLGNFTNSDSYISVTPWSKVTFLCRFNIFLLNFLLWKSDRMENKYPNFVRLTTWNHPKWRQSRYIFITWWLYIYLISPCDFEFWSIIALVNEFFVAKYIEQYKLIRNACFLPQGPLSLIEIDMKIGTRTIITKRLQYNLTSNF